MTIENTQCDVVRIHRLLEQKLAPHEEHEIESHLEQCASCRANLGAAAAKPVSWDNAVKFLPDAPFELSPLSDIPSTFDD